MSGIGVPGRVGVKLKLKLNVIKTIDLGMSRVETYRLA